MSLSRPEKPSLGRPSGDEHWTRKMKKENAKLLGQIAFLEKILTDNKIDVPSSESITATSSTGGGDGGSDGDEGRDDRDGQPPSGDDGDDDDDYDSSDGEGELTDFIDVYVKCNFPNNKVGFGDRILFYTNGNWKLRSLGVLMSNKFKLSPNAFRFLKSDGGVCYSHLTFTENGVKSNATLSASLRIGGGAPFRSVKSKFVKKEDALVMKKKQISDNFKVPDDEVVRDADLPEIFKPVVQDFNAQLAEFMTVKARVGSDFIRLCLGHLRKEDLTMLLSIFSPAQGSKKLTNEEKATRALHILFPILKRIHTCMGKLQMMENDTVASLLHIFLDEYNSFNQSSGALTIDGTAFLKQVEKEIEKRDQNTPADLNPDVLASNCQIQ